MCVFACLVQNYCEVHKTLITRDFRRQKKTQKVNWVILCVIAYPHWFAILPCKYMLHIYMQDLDFKWQKKLQT